MKNVRNYLYSEIMIALPVAFEAGKTIIYSIRPASVANVHPPVVWDIWKWDEE